MLKLKPCPFCGHETPEFERAGTPRHSCVIDCGNCGCRHESSDEGERSGASWNERTSDAIEQENEKLKAEKAMLREALKVRKTLLSEIIHAVFNMPPIRIGNSTIVDEIGCMEAEDDALSATASSDASSPESDIDQAQRIR